VAGQNLAPTSSVVFTTTGGTGNHDTVTFASDGDYVEIINLGATRISVIVDPGATDPTVDGDGTITVPAGGTLLEPSRARGSTAVKAISSAACDVAMRVVHG